LATLLEGQVPAELNAFIGRAGDLAEAASKLQAARLVTIIGPGGVGKTRLSQRLAAEVKPAFRDGVVIADLTPLRASEQHFDQAVTEALGIVDNARTSGLESIVDHFRDKQALLILDNCEHLVGSVRRMAQTVLQAAPDLRILATSRKTLGVRGEHQLVLRPLPAEDALQLLLDRAAAVRPDWSQALRAGGRLPADVVTAARRLCRMLDGLPLAIELAAARLASMTIHEVVERLDDRFALLVDGEGTEQQHHRSLRAMLDWSHELLSPPQRHMWAMASVFAGGFDIDGAEVVCSGQGVDRPEVLNLLSQLVRNSLLIAEARGGRTRYRMLETIREYGAQLVNDETTKAALQQAHADYYYDLVESATHEWFGPQEIVWLRRLQLELSNIRFALDFFLSRPEQKLRGLGMAVCAMQTRFQVLGGALEEARRFLEYGLAEHPAEPSPLQVIALAMCAWLGLIQGEPADARPFLRAAEHAAAALGVETESAGLLFAQGTELWLTEPHRGKARGAVEVFSRAEDRFRAEGSLGGAQMAVLFKGITAGFLADRPTAMVETERGLAGAEAAGAPWCLAWALWARALAEMEHGDPYEAVPLVQRSVRMELEMGDRWGTLWGVWLRACLASAMGDFALAATLFGGATTLSRRTKVTVARLLPFLRAQQHAERLARRELGDEQFDQHLAAGDALPEDELMTLVMQPVARMVPEQSRPRPGGLSARELEVAELVARGMKNREIADELNTAYRTVETQVRNIMTKLRVSRRVEIATWVAVHVHPAVGNAGEDAAGIEAPAVAAGGGVQDGASSTRTSR
jgi:non-specific serine/threonine protein kinase